MKYFIGVLWIFVVIFIHILIKYSLRLKISSLLLDMEKEKFVSEYYNKRVNMMDKVDEKQGVEKVDNEAGKVEDEDLYAMNLEKYIQNNTGSQVVYDNLDSNIGNKYNMKTMNNVNESPLFGNTGLKSFDDPFNTFSPFSN